MYNPIRYRGVQGTHVPGLTTNYRLTNSETKTFTLCILGRLFITLIAITPIIRTKNGTILPKKRSQSNSEAGG